MEKILPIKLTKTQYLIGLAVIFAAAFSQYFYGQFGFISGFLVVYGVPIAFLLLLRWPRAIIRNFFARTSRAVWIGIASFGFWSLLGRVASIIIFYALYYLDPTSLNLLSRPSPVLNLPPEFAFAMIWLSIILVGPLEEFIYRGFVFGGLLNIFKNKHWLLLAFFSSVLFAGAHLYYAFVYRLASLTIFVDLITFGMAMCFTYYYSGGNLFIPAILHGLFDAAGFSSVVLSPSLNSDLRFWLILLGFAFAAVFYFNDIMLKKSSSSPQNRV